MKREEFTREVEAEKDDGTSDVEDIYGGEARTDCNEHERNHRERGGANTSSLSERGGGSDGGHCV
jgi:hypothetical protein